MLKTLAKFLIPTLLLVAVLLPSLSHAALINCGNTDASGKIVNPCDFNYFIDTINNIIKWIISVSTIIFTLSAVWSGFLWMTAGDNTGQIEEAKSILWSTLKGFLFILVAWLIVYTIINLLVPQNSEYRNSIFKFIGKGN